MSKYEPLKQFLQQIPSNISEKTLSFSEIERILGFKLPYSAYEHRAWWSNPSSPADHPYAQSWLTAGWMVDIVNQNDKWVYFRRTSSRPVEMKTPHVSQSSPSFKSQKDVYKVGVKECILLFYREIEDDQFHRYLSWEHCYTFFQKHHISHDNDSIDAAALHLAFYLASWGMYRGSSQLLQKDYRVHTKIVTEILDDKYTALWDMDFDKINTASPEVDRVIESASTIARIYSGLQISPTNTLVTKVLLGTFGCIPAYDSFFINGVTYWNQDLPEESKLKFPARFGKSSYRGLIDFYREKQEEFREAQAYIEQRSITYPVMKLVDMYFWSLGYQIGR